MTEEHNEQINDNTEPTPTPAPSSEGPKIETGKSYRTIGELLRSKREEKGLNLKTISQQTKIHMGLLEHLENDELAKLPSKTYVKGFVKSAAKILGIDQETALNLLEETYSGPSKTTKKEAPKVVHTPEEPTKSPLNAMAGAPLETVKSVTASSTAFLAKAAVGLIILGVIGFNIKNLIDRSAEERMKLPQVLSTVHQKTKPAPKPAEPRPETKVATEAPKNEDIKVNIIQDHKGAVTKSELTVNGINLKGISLGEKQFSEDNSLTKEQMDEYLPARYRVPPTKGVETVFINAVDGDSWITYKIDDKEIKKFVLRQGRTVFIRGNTVRLFVGNAKAIKVFYNNKLINLNSKSGIKNVVLPEESKTKFMTPLFVFQKDGSVLTSEDYIKQNQEQKTAPLSSPTAPVNGSSVQAKQLPKEAPATPRR